MTFVIDPAMLGLMDHVALVTGAGGLGMGRAHCLHLARAGCHIVAADIDVEGLAQTVNEVERLGRRAIAVEANALVAAQVQQMVRKAFDTFGRLDVAVNHVGGAPAPVRAKGRAIPFLDHTEEQWDATFDLNIKSTFLCCQAEALAMIEHGIPGRIINIASASGVYAAANTSAYGAAKAGVIHLTKTLAVEFAPYNIRVNCIVPGAIMNESIATDPNASLEQKQWHAVAAKAAPLGRTGRPADVAGLTVFFASKLSDYVTGQSLLADGGLVLTTARPNWGGDLKPAVLENV